MNYKVLIIDDMHSSIIPMLESLGYVPDYQPKLKREEVLKIIGNYEGLLVRTKIFIDKEILDQAQKLKFIGRAGSGLDNIDLKEVKSRNIKVINAPEGNRDAVAEHTLGLLLALLRHIPQADTQIRDFVWEREANRGIEIKGKTISIIGYGNIGRALAQRLSGFECKVLAYDIALNYGNQYAQEATMEEIFAETDILTLHIPLTSHTREMVNQEYIHKFKKNIILINTSRGEIVQTNDLIQSLEEGKVRGACLDVLENEKLNTFTPAQIASFEKLTQSNQVILSPHVAGWTFESYVRINEVLIEKLKALDFNN
jgi:D-3-phosphoglycerate dehydrogenase